MAAAAQPANEWKRDLGRLAYAIEAERELAYTAATPAELHGPLTGVTFQYLLPLLTTVGKLVTVVSFY